MDLEHKTPAKKIILSSGQATTYITVESLENQGAALELGACRGLQTKKKSKENSEREGKVTT